MQRKRPCPFCGTDLNTWGPDRKGSCPDCTSARKGTKVVCAGKCKRIFELRTMQAVNLVFDPGQRGGKNIKVYYCPQCFSSARSKARLINEEQQGAIKKMEDRMRRGGVRTKGERHVENPDSDRIDVSDPANY